MYITRVYTQLRLLSIPAHHYRCVYVVERKCITKPIETQHTAVLCVAHSNSLHSKWIGYIECSLCVCVPAGTEWVNECMTQSESESGTRARQYMLQISEYGDAGQQLRNTVSHKHWQHNMFEEVLYGCKCPMKFNLLSLNHSLSLTRPIFISCLLIVLHHFHFGSFEPLQVQCKSFKIVIKRSMRLEPPLHTLTTTLGQMINSKREKKRTYRQEENKWIWNIKLSQADEL